jgi:hypothetical protein
MTPLSAGRPGSEAPLGWRWARLTDLARLETGHTPSRSHPEWWGGPIPWISLADIRELDGKVAQDTIEHTNEKGIANGCPLASGRDRRTVAHGLCRVRHDHGSTHGDESGLRELGLRARA